MSKLTIGVDMGHTIRGLGTGAASILSETNENRKIGNELISLLKSNGHTVVNCTVDVSNNDLADRVAIANRQRLDLFISIHLNAGGGHGTETYIYNQYYNGKEANREVAKRINDKVVASCGFRNRGVKEANYYVLRETVAPAVLLEVCFVDSQEDASKLNYKAVAKAIAEAITGESFGSQPVPPISSSISVGTKVKIIGSNYATGQPIPNWVKQNIYTVQEISGDRALIQEIVSWVYLRDIQAVSSQQAPSKPTFNPYIVKVNTDVLNVRTGPSTNYSIATQVKMNEAYTIVDESNGWGKLKSGIGWISLDYTKRI